MVLYAKQQARTCPGHYDASMMLDHNAPDHAESQAPHEFKLRRLNPWLQKPQQKGGLTGSNVAAAVMLLSQLANADRKPCGVIELLIVTLSCPSVATTASSLGSVDH